MSPPATTSPLISTPPLGTVAAAPDDPSLWVDRSAEASRLLRFLGEARGRIVVLYGKRGIGKTALIRRWVLPRLGPTRGFYLDLQTSPGSPGDDAQLDRLWLAMKDGAIAIVDSAEALLDAPAEDRDGFFRHALAVAQEAASRPLLVLVVNEDRLHDVFGLHAQVPDILDHTLEIGGIDLRRGLAALLPVPEPVTPPRSEAPSDGSGSGQVAVGEDQQVRAQGGAESAPSRPGSAAATASAPSLTGGTDDSLAAPAGKTGVSPELLRIVASRLRRSPPALAVATAERAGGIDLAGLESILWDYLKERLESLADGALVSKTRFELGLAIVEEVAAAGKSSLPLRLEDIALRVGVGADACRRVVAELQGTGCIREFEPGRYTLVPAELTAVVIAESNRRQANSRDSVYLIDQGVAAWRADNALLSRADFREVQRHRRSLRLQPEEIELLVRSSLLHDDDPELSAARYWMQRLADRKAAADVLSSSLFHRSEKVRAHAAALLADFPDSEVCNQLHALALRDDDVVVRRCAVASLARMKTEELRGLLLAELSADNSPYRETALATLRIFDDDATVGSIRSLLAKPGLDRGLRRTAIQVLAQLEIPGAADVLLELGLSAAESEDRQAAIHALAAIQSEPVQAHVLDALRTARPSREPVARPSVAVSLARATRLGAWLLLALAIAVVNLVVHGFVLLLHRRYRPAVALLAAEGLGLALLLASVAAFGGESAWLTVASCMVLATLTLSQLGAVRVTLDEIRQSGAAAGSPRGLCGAMLCLSCLVGPASLVHGLVHLAARRARQGACLFALALTGGLLSGIVDTLQSPQFADASNGWDRLLAVTSGTYFWLGFALFWGTLAYDVFGTLLRDVWLRNFQELRERRQAIYRLLFKNRAAARCALASLASQDRREARWARWIVSSYGADFEPEPLLTELEKRPPASRRAIVCGLSRSKTESTIHRLAAAWGGADREARGTIVSILARHPSEASIAALQEQDLRWWLRWRCRLAEWQFRFNVWPVAALIAMLVALPPVAVLGTEGYKALHDPSWTQLRLVEQRDKPAAQWHQAQRLHTAEFLAQVYPRQAERRLEALFRRDQGSPELCVGFAKSLGTIVAESDDGDTARAARAALVHATQRSEGPNLRWAALVGIGTIKTERIERTLVDAVTAVLANPQDDVLLRRRALRDLAGMRCHGSAAALTNFVATRTPPGPGPDQRREEGLRHEAITALAHMGTLEAIMALRELERSAATAGLKHAAHEAAADPLQGIRDELRHFQPELAATLAKAFLGPGGAAVAPQAEVWTLLGKAYIHIARDDVPSQALGHWRTAAQYLSWAQAAGSRDPDVPRLLALVEDRLSTR